MILCFWTNRHEELDQIASKVEICIVYHSVCNFLDVRISKIFYFQIFE